MLTGCLKTSEQIDGSEKAIILKKKILHQILDNLTDFLFTSMYSL